jgi:hypothetical protein
VNALQNEFEALGLDEASTRRGSQLLAELEELLRQKAEEVEEARG